MPTTEPVAPRWRFFRAGGFDQVALDQGSLLTQLDRLDQKLWVALACPTTGLEFDTKTLQLIDADKDGRIRAPEVIAAAKWAVSCLKDPDEFLRETKGLPLAAINDATAEGRQLLASARQILANLGKPEASVITVEDTTDTARIFAATTFNGDGVIPAEAAEDAAIKAVIQDIIACLGAETDRGGKPGITQAKLEQFFADAQAFVAWHDKATLPLGDQTPAAAATVQAVRTKIDDYFARTRLANFDPRSVAALNRQETEYLELAAKDLTISATELASFPLALVEPGKPLPLNGTVNPAWADAITALRPLVGGADLLSFDQWQALKSKLAPYESWIAAKGGATVEKLGINRVREILAGPSRTEIEKLLARDKALEPEANAIASVDRLVRYHRDLPILLNNFVSFRDFYQRQRRAIFQAGTLYLDQRSCELCVQVTDMAKHGLLAGLSRCYLAYCDCTRKATGEKMTIVAAFTNGDSDNLMVGRNGVFYDRQGRDWDATIIKIIDNPISIRQAFWMPYKKFLRFVEEQIAKRAAAAEAASDSKVADLATATVNADKNKPGTPPKKIDVGTVAAIGVAVGGITAALGAMLQAFFGLGFWMPLGVLGLLLVISGPSMLIAGLKLRQRNLGPLLDANGWAINAKAKINIPFGSSLTKIATLPAGAVRNLVDPYADKNVGRNRIILWSIVLLLWLVAWGAGYLNHVVSAKLQPRWGQSSPSAR